jgi:ribose 5-phosphate isomerase B
MAKKILISEQTVLDAARKGQKTLSVDPGAIVTGAAADRAKQLGLAIVERKPDAARSSMPATGLPTASSKGGAEQIAIGSDHGGFPMKEQLRPFIEQMGYKVVDLGTYAEEACDYPDFAYAVARMVSLRQAGKGIMIDSVGIASAMVANKIHGVRAACCSDEFTARSSREHNDANVLTLGGKTLGIELAKAIVKAWLETGFGGGRHAKRIAKIEEIEKRPQGS